MAGFFFHREGQSYGPFDEHVLRSMLQGGVIDEHTLIWSDQDSSPVACGDLLKRLPPPLPPIAAVRAIRLEQPLAVSLEGDWETSPPHPWRRFFARVIDIYTLGLLMYVLLLIGWLALSPEPEHVLQTVQQKWVGSLLIVLLMVPASAVFLGLTGLTPGKWVAGIRVLTPTGTTMGLAKAFRREFQVYFQGQACGIVLLSLFAQVWAYLNVTQYGSCAWDRTNDLVVHYRPNTFAVIARTVFALIVCAAAVVLLAGQAYDAK